MAKWSAVPARPPLTSLSRHPPPCRRPARGSGRGLPAEIAAKSNEIPAFAPLLERLDLRGCVITADAMHTQIGHAQHVIARGGHYILVVKGNQTKLRRQLRHLPWREVPLQHRTREQGDGRREIRRLKVCTVQPGLLFPYAVQAIEVKPRRTSRTTNQDHHQDDLRGHQPRSRAGHPATDRRTDPRTPAG
ncbi:ISAs1 family transposase [Streptomyces sp. NPDC001530]|uniref:ISAs1 family transposase n=1 Tax=Streptomyces sp. NPDC001530 TaxID=3364582 RepID=UPI0036A00542